VFRRLILSDPGPMTVRLSVPVSMTIVLLMPAPVIVPMNLPGPVTVIVVFLSVSVISCRSLIRLV
jgi:hypothetical protein